MLLDCWDNCLWDKKERFVILDRNFTESLDCYSLLVQNILVQKYMSEFKSLTDSEVNLNINSWILIYSKCFRKIWDEMIDSWINNNSWVVITLDEIEKRLYSEKTIILIKSVWVAINHELGEELALAA